MTEEILEQLELFKKYNVTNNYIIKNNKIHIEGNLYLRSLTSIPDSNFLNNTVIGGSLELYSLKDSDEDILYSNIKKLVNGTYDKERGYCYFDYILRSVDKVTTKKGYVIYETPFDYVIQKGDFTAHSKTVKQGIIDVEFKIVRDKIKQEPINTNTVFSVEYYRMLTGACDLGCRGWLEANEIPYKIEGNKTVEVSPMVASDLLVILEKSKPYGYDKFKSLLTF